MMRWITTTFDRLEDGIVINGEITLVVRVPGEEKHKAGYIALDEKRNDITTISPAHINLNHVFGHQGIDHDRSSGRRIISFL